MPVPVLYLRQQKAVTNLNLSFLQQQKQLSEFSVTGWHHYRTHSFFILLYVRFILKRNLVTADSKFNAKVIASVKENNIKFLTENLRTV